MNKDEKIDFLIDQLDRPLRELYNELVKTGILNLNNKTTTITTEETFFKMEIKITAITKKDHWLQNFDLN